LSRQSCVIWQKLDVVHYCVVLFSHRHAKNFMHHFKCVSAHDPATIYQATCQDFGPFSSVVVSAEVAFFV
jgi:hypothetical protein